MDLDLGSASSGYRTPCPIISIGDSANDKGPIRIADEALPISYT